MRVSQILFAVLFLLMGALPLHADHEKVTQTFLEAFKVGDSEGMSKAFASEVLFIGEHRFIGRDERLTKPVVISKKDLTKHYALLFKGRQEQWSVVAKNLKPTFVVSEKDGELLGLTKKGDIICDVHFREASKGKRNRYDEAVIFVFRKTENSYEVVAHLADY